ncbi:Serine/threonine protein kinase [Parafrankia irregularis]|uniref:Serine/threonine protein kinase n=1 Tax=Parafrankia irregularis TaxID=795642 RepID=A0A0S4R122_9ACTN|nr:MULTISPECIES: serine/threonine-protein kinase [Parafrankia]MBE3200677.1 serine/threonine protein kinase [Parafrankia sp. CH37]CUU60506.1 Serine/threonine protein kinase [Parafrankia irregularis]
MAIGGVKPLRPTDPRLIGPHTLESVLGSGGMGRVYLGRSPAGRRVAIKVIHDHLARDEQYLARFQREARIAYSVAPFCTAEVLDFGVFDGRPYIVTEFLEGPTLAEAVTTHGPLSTTDLHQLAVSIAAALISIHSAGLVHRDIKPANVLLSKTGPRVIDFGVAMSIESQSLLTNASDTIGTPAFMAPEQAAREPTGASADVFAWGGVLAFAGTGRSPFGIGAPPIVMYRVVHEEPDLDGLDSRLLPLVRAAMSKRPADRPSAAELLGELTGSTRPSAALTASGSSGQAHPRGVTPAPAWAPEPEQDAELRRRTSVPPPATATGFGPPATPPPPPAHPAPVQQTSTAPTAAPQPAADEDAVANGLPAAGPRSSRRRRSQRETRRRRAVGAAAATAAVLGATGVALLVGGYLTDSDDPGAKPAPTVASSTQTPTASAGPQYSEQDWISVLQQLDQARVAAFESADVGLLSRVYAEGSGARAADEEAIELMSSVGAHGRGGQQTVQSVEVVTHNASVVVLRFTASMAPFTVVAADGSVVDRRPGATSTIREVNLVSTPEGWRVTVV